MLTHAAVHPTNHWYRWMFIPTYINIYSNMVVQKSYIYIYIYFYILEWDTNIRNDIGYELPHFHIQPWYVLTHTQYHSEIPFRNPMIFPRDLLGELSTFQRHGRDLQGRLRRRIGHQPSTPHLDVIQDPEGTGLKPVDMENAEHEQIAMHVPRNILCISEKCACTLAIEIHMYICSYVYMYIYIYHILYQKNKSLYIYIYILCGRVWSVSSCHTSKENEPGAPRFFFGRATTISMTGPIYAPGISGSVTFMVYSMTNHGSMICCIQYGMRYVSIYIYIYMLCISYSYHIYIYIYKYLRVYIYIII